MIVKDIKFINNKVEVILEEKSFFISKENYIENPVAIDSSIDENRISYLLDYEAAIESKIYLIKLLNKKALSEYEVYLKLKDRNVKKQYIKAVIESLKRAGLINDEFVALITMEGLLVKRKGKKEIIRVLKEKRISDEIINKVIESIEEIVYLDNFNKVVDKYQKMYSQKSFKFKENMVRQKLESLGYEGELINAIELKNDSENEKELAKKSLMKLMKNKNIDLNSYENINKIKTKLIMKGFSYDIINLALEEVKKDETY